MFYIPPLTGMFYFSGCTLQLASEQLRFTQLGFPIRKSSDRRLLRTSPKHIVATLRPSSPFDVKASIMCPYANHPNTDLSFPSTCSREMTLSLSKDYLHNLLSNPSFSSRRKNFSSREIKGGRFAPTNHTLRIAARRCATSPAK